MGLTPLVVTPFILGLVVWVMLLHPWGNVAMVAMGVRAGGADQLMLVLGIIVWVGDVTVALVALIFIPVLAGMLVGEVRCACPDGAGWDSVEAVPWPRPLQIDPGGVPPFDGTRPYGDSAHSHSLPKFFPDFFRKTKGCARSVMRRVHVVTGTLGLFVRTRKIAYC